MAQVPPLQAGALLPQLAPQAPQLDGSSRVSAQSAELPLPQVAKG